MSALALPLRPFAAIGRFAGDTLQGLGRVAMLVGAAFGHSLRRPVHPGALVYQLLQIGVRSMGLALTMALFTGMVLAFQFGVGLERFGAKLFIGQTTVTALFREIAPLLTALVVGGRVGAGIAAELGVMAVTEQLDAMRALGADPLQRLVAPRIFATMIALPLLLTAGVLLLIVAILQTAIDDPPAKFRIVIECCDEAADLPMPVLGRAVGELIFDHEVLHRRSLMPCRGRIGQSGAPGCIGASMDKNDSMDFPALAPILT